jgi:hypothetical protein
MQLISSDEYQPITEEQQRRAVEFNADDIGSLDADDPDHCKYIMARLSQRAIRPNTFYQYNVQLDLFMREMGLSSGQVITADHITQFLGGKYIQSKGQAAWNTIRLVLASINHYCADQNIPSPVKVDENLKTQIKGLRNTLLSARPVLKRLGIDDKTLSLLYHKWPKLSSVGIRNAVVATLCFHGLLRVNECLLLKWTDVLITADGFLSLMIRQGKTNKDLRGDVVIIAPRTDMAHCPVKVFKDWKVLCDQHPKPFETQFMFGVCRDVYNSSLKLAIL